MNIIFLVVFIVLGFAFLISPLLQVYLSMKANKWFGLMIPGCIVGFGVLSLLVVLLRAGEPNSFMSIIIIYSIIWFSMIFVHLVIYFICRSVINNRNNKGGGPKVLKNTDNTEIKKMKIEDLE